MGAGRDGRGSSDEVFFEFKQIGAQVRVAAIDARTGIEVIIIAPVTATQIQMQNLALAKLKRRLESGH
jgi:translation initiation factor 1 (eIF-1/SUI1)